MCQTVLRASGLHRESAKRRLLCSRERLWITKHSGRQIDDDRGHQRVLGDQTQEGVIKVKVSKRVMGRIEKAFISFKEQNIEHVSFSQLRTGSTRTRKTVFLPRDSVRTLERTQTSSWWTSSEESVATLLKASGAMVSQKKILS